MSKNLLQVVKYFTPESYNDAPVKVIGDGPRDEKGNVNSTIIRVSPTPYGSPSKKDLHGQFFKAPAKDFAGTYFGDNIVTTKFGLYEHGMNDINNPEMQKFGKLSNILGPAHLVKMEGDPTRWFDIEVRRSLQYHDWLLELIDLKVMGASTQAFMNNVEVDQEGGIDLWLENEVGPTVSPANPETIKQMASLLKAPKFISLPSVMVKTFDQGQLVDYVIERDDMGNKKTKKTEEPVVVEDVEETEENQEQETVADLAAELNDILSDEDADEETPDEIVLDIPEGTPQAVVDVLEKMAAQLNAQLGPMKAQMSVFMEIWGSDIEEAKNAILSMMGQAKTTEEISKKLDKMTEDQIAMTKAFVNVARYMKSMKMSQAAETVNRMSQLEREILEDEEDQQSKKSVVRSRSVAPQGAPGTY